VSAPKWAVGMQRITPGFYADREGSLHVDLIEMCELAGVPPTPDNQAVVEKAARAAAARYWPRTRVVEVDEIKKA
jgi:hypothetical protein